ncbi:MAG: LysM peptidoglycan-binding domain-containing protein [Planctomycetaceae bacterium]|jgi:nucleoid-associated protein YgaU|nr:LysM peptidoglycan-binding domain-containing protein [Planctomycetaceae bacterium]
MSKTEKQNSEISSLESELNGLVNDSSASADKMIRKPDQKTEPLTDNPDEVSDNENILKRLFSFLSIFPFLYHQAVKGICKSVSFVYTQIRNVTTLSTALWFRVAAFFTTKTVVSSDNDNNNSDDENGKVKEEEKKIPQTVKPQTNQFAAKTVKVNEGNNVNENIEDEEDIGFRWLNLGFKVTATAVVVLLLTGGYFGVKSFLGKPKPISEATALESVEEKDTDTETVDDTKNTQQESPDLALPPLPSQVFAAKKTVSETKPDKKTPIEFTPPPVVTLAKESMVKKTLETTPEKPNEKQTVKQTDKPVEKPEVPTKQESAVATFKEQKKSVPEPEKDVTVKNKNIKDPPPASDPWSSNISSSTTTVDNFSDPIVPSTVASPAPPVTTNIAAPPELPISLDAPTAQTEKPAVVPNPLALQTTPPELPATSLTEPNQPATLNLTPLEIPNTEIPTTAATPVASVTVPAKTVTDSAETVQLTPLKMQSAVTDTVSSSSSSIPPIISNTSNISGDQSLTIPKSDGEIQTLPQFSAFSEPTSEQSLHIPEQSKTDTISSGFSKAPTPPEMSTPITSPAMEPFIPVVATKKEETIPAIPNSGIVQPIADFSASDLSSSTPEPPMSKQSISEPPLAIPTDSVTFSQPATQTVSSPTPVTPTPYAPPTFAPPTTSAPFISNTPNTQNSATNTTVPNTKTVMNTETVAKNTEPMLEIPKDSQHSDTAVSTTVSTVTILPQHRELAKVEPPLGSQLQNQVREIRNQESSEPKLRFGSDAHAPTGAVRYHPKSTVQNIADLVPSQPMPIDTADPNSNPLIALLPTGNSQLGATDSLPPLETAPQPVTATPNPGYRRLSNQEETPVSVQPETLPVTANAANNTTAMNNVANNSDRQAKLFRRIDEAIKRSPTTTEQYTVQKNDTYMTISDQFFGTSRLFRALAEYNRQKFGTDYKLPEGTVIEIPPIDYLKNNYAEVLSRSGQRPEKSATTTVSVQGVRYVVQDEDTVFRIATNQLRDSSRWQEIIDMNLDKLRSPRDLQPGMEIILPAATATQTSYGRR